jgi:hypothetical protein
MYSILLFIAAGTLPTEAPPPVQVEVQKFDQAMAESRFKDAGAIIDTLIAQRTPADGIPRQDPLLNALMGRLYLAGHQVDAAQTYLAHTPLADLPPSIRASTALARGRALELRGKRSEALSAYREAAAAVPATDAQRRKAALAIARQLLVDNPQEASDEVSAIAKGAATPERWEASYILALASSLRRDIVSAQRHADAAWADAANAPLPDLAPLHVETLHAGLAAARHDPVRQRSMLIATNGLSLSASPALSAQLPVCGDNGIQPTDFVTFGYLAGPYATTDLVPIAASRLQVVATFLDAFAGIVPIAEADGSKPIGTVFTVACRSVVSANMLRDPAYGDPLLEWFVDKGIYPASASNDSADAHLNAVGERISTLAARFGNDSPLLTAARWQMLTMLENRARAGDMVLTGQVVDLASRLTAGLKSAGAPAWVTSAITARSHLEQSFANDVGDADLMSTLEGTFREALVQTPFDYAHAYAVGITSRFPDQWTAPAARMVIDLNPKALAVLKGRERQAWLMNLAKAQETLGKTAEMHSTIASAGFGKDLCLAADAPPKLLEQHFSYDDYPEDLIAGEQEGSVLFDFAIAADGSVTEPRVIYSLPAGLFDAPSAKGLGTVRYSPATRDGKTEACRGLFQPILWRLEHEDEFSIPKLTPETDAPTT